MRSIARETEERLGFDEVLAAVAECAASPLGRQAILALKPLPRARDAQAAATLVAEWTGLLMRAIDPPLAGIGDVTQSLAELAVAGTLLEPARLYELAAFAAAAENLRAHFARHRDAAPHCWEIAARLQAAPASRKAIERAIAPNGDVLDGASPELRRIRRELSSMDGRIAALLQRSVDRLREEGALSDDYVTQRNGRYVLPVKSGSRGKVQGIVHDASNTGQTVFVEPFAVVELSNERADLQRREAEEVRRILIELTDLARSELPAYRINLGLLPQLDAIYARARFGVRHQCAMPRLDERAAVDLRDAHHPLLYLSRRAQSIPIAIRLDPGDRVLMVSGPNAGGKTTALKTLGLHCMMAQCAIPAPLAANSTLPVFSRFFADIGDDQDVQAGLSTFSSHIRAIARVIDNADERTLALLDELGTATDPSEGGCLAVAIAERLCERAALTVITSHLAVLKHWAHEEPRARNASFRLDDNTHRPSFVLAMDVPGTSEALIVAEQQGLDAALIARAREILPPGEEDVSSLILSLQRKSEELDALKAELDDRTDAMEAERERYRKLFEQYQAERREFRKGLLEEKRRAIEAGRAEVERRIAHLPAKQDLTRAREELRREREAVAAEIEALAEPPPPPVDAALLREGGAVDIDGMADPGLIVSLDPDRARAQVRVKALTMELPLSRLRPASAERANIVKDAVAPSSARGGRAVRVVRRVEGDFKLELELHGMYVEEAVEALDQYLSDAAVHDAKHVKVMHGTGTGRLRSGVHEFLKAHPLVKHFRYGLPEEGGAGVTVVELRE